MGGTHHLAPLVGASVVNGQKVSESNEDIMSPVQQFLEQAMNADTFIALRQLLESVGALAIAFILALVVYFGVRALWKSLENNRESIEQVKESNKQTANLIEELRNTNKTIQALTDTAIRIEGHAKDAATSSYKSVEQTEATLRDIKKLERIITDGIASILTAQNDHEGKAMTRQTGTQASIDRLEQRTLDILNRFADARAADNFSFEEVQRDLSRIIRYTKPKTTGNLPVEDVEAIEAEQNAPNSKIA